MRVKKPRHWGQKGVGGFLIIESPWDGGRGPTSGVPVGKGLKVLLPTEASTPPNRSGIRLGVLAPSLLLGRRSPPRSGRSRGTLEARRKCRERPRGCRGQQTGADGGLWGAGSALEPSAIHPHVCRPPPLPQQAAGTHSCPPAPALGRSSSEGGIAAAAQPALRAARPRGNHGGAAAKTAPPAAADPGR